MTLIGELAEFFSYFEISTGLANDICKELASKEFITSRQQLFLLDDKSWKSISIADLVVRDGLEAWINDDIKIRETIDEIPVESLLQNIQKYSGWSAEEVAELSGLLRKARIVKLKHLKALKKKTLYKIGLPVLLVQELRKEVKRIITEDENQIQGSTASILGFKLPIVGSSGETGDSGNELTQNKLAALSISIRKHGRVIREVNGKTYEFDSKCPHKAADLTNAPIEGSILICPKHKWKFDLDHGGLCLSKPSCSVNARILDW